MGDDSFDNVGRGQRVATLDLLKLVLTLGLRVRVRAVHVGQNGRLAMDNNVHLEVVHHLFGHCVRRADNYLVDILLKYMNCIIDTF